MYSTCANIFGNGVFRKGFNCTLSILLVGKFVTSLESLLSYVSVCSCLVKVRLSLNSSRKQLFLLAEEPELSLL